MSNLSITLPSTIVRDLWRYYVPHMPYDHAYHRDVLIHERLFTHDNDPESWIQEMGFHIKWNKNRIFFLSTRTTSWERSRWWKSRIKPVHLGQSQFYVGASKAFGTAKTDTAAVAILMVAIAYHDLNPLITVEDWFRFLVQYPDEIKGAYERYRDEGSEWYLDMKYDILMFYIEPATVLSNGFSPSNTSEGNIYL